MYAVLCLSAINTKLTWRLDPATVRPLYIPKSNSAPTLHGLYVISPIHGQFQHSVRNPSNCWWIRKLVELVCTPTRLRKRPAAMLVHASPFRFYYSEISFRLKFWLWYSWIQNRNTSKTGPKCASRTRQKREFFSEIRCFPVGKPDSVLVTRSSMLDGVRLDAKQLLVEAFTKISLS